MRKPIITGAILLLLTLLLAAPAHTQGTPLSDYKICLDPGHGGYDPGAVYDEGRSTSKRRTSTWTWPTG